MPPNLDRPVAAASEWCQSVTQACKLSAGVVSALVMMKLLLVEMIVADFSGRHGYTFAPKLAPRSYRFRAWFRPERSAGEGSENLIWLLCVRLA